MDVPAMLAEHPVIEQLSEQALRARRAIARGSIGSSTPFVAAALSRSAQRPVLLVVAHVDEADEALDALNSAKVRAVLFPALQSLPGESHAASELLAARLGIVQTAMDWSAPGSSGPPPGTVIIAPIQALMQSVPTTEALAASLLTLSVKQHYDPRAVVHWLTDAGYTRTDAVEEAGDFALRGGILDIFPPGDSASATLDEQGRAVSTGGVPVRLDFFGDEIDKIAEIDLDTMATDRSVHAVRLIRVSSSANQDVEAPAPTKRSIRNAPPTGAHFVDLLPPTTITVLHELMELTEQGRGYYERLTGDNTVFGPPAVFRAITQRCAATIEITALGEYASGGDPVIQLPLSPPLPLADEIGDALKDVARMASGEDGRAEPVGVTIFCQNAAEQSRLNELLTEHAPGASTASLPARRITSTVQYLPSGFIWTREGSKSSAERGPHMVLAYHELLKRFTARRARFTSGGPGRLRAGRAMDTFLDIQVGDYVVHTDHGIALFTGLKFVKPQDSKASVADRLAGKNATVASTDDPEEFLTLEFAGGSKLHVPATKIDQVQKYIGGGGSRGKPPLSTLGGDRWKNQKARVAESVKNLAAQLLRVRAAREHLPGIQYPADTTWQREFEDEFPWDETEDQLAALSEIKRDMTSPRPMDRLLCGDVGYGKTELAIRAAFKCAEYGKQVGVLVPTTVLAEQHERTFKSRFADYPFVVESISRFKTDGEIRAILERVRSGQVDILIGTHRIVSQDVIFSDLGLVVIDEEQRFGVEHKEKLLALRMTVDVLTLSATPIPRTLHMSLLGIRDISSLTTAPMDRRAVVTEVIPYNARRIEQAIRREMARDGQVFFVHNRVHNIQSVADDIQKLVPEARIVIGHGQMSPGELEEVMLKFMRKQADILVSTTIIESGIDISSANTMIIADADRFGLADLHQLRGRVGRGSNRGYCYLLLPDDRPVKEKAKQRLKAIEQYNMLGAGFKIAMRDLEIRGAGNILGPEQSGHIAAVGYDMYCQLLERSVKELRNEITAAPSETNIDIGVTGCIPKPYIPSDQRRLEAYRRIAIASTHDELERVRKDLQSAYGDIPESAERLIQMAEVRVGSRLLSIKSISVRDKDVIIRTTEPQSVAERFESSAGRVTALPINKPTDMPEVYFRPENPGALGPKTLLAILRKRLGPRGEVARAASSSPAPKGGPSTSSGVSVKVPKMSPPPKRGRSIQ